MEDLVHQVLPSSLPRHETRTPYLCQGPQLNKKIKLNAPRTKPNLNIKLIIHKISNSHELIGNGNVFNCNATITIN